MSLREELKRRLKGKVVLVGVGNPMWGDDGAGPAIIRRLEGRTAAVLVDGGEAPEDFWGAIVSHRPQTVLVVDALVWGGEPGSVALLDRVQETGSPLSTHRVSLNVFLDLLRKETGAHVFVLGIQPKDLSFPWGLSPEIQQTVELLASCLGDIPVRGARCS